MREMYRVLGVEVSVKEVEGGVRKVRRRVYGKIGGDVGIDKIERWIGEE
jgi:hypothetical protein